MALPRRERGTRRQIPWLLRPEDAQQIATYFVLYPETDVSKAECGLNASAWLFYVISREDIDKQFGNNKSVTLEKLKTLCKPVQYNNVNPESQ